MPVWLPEGDVSVPFDQEIRSLWKIVSGGGGGGGAGASFYGTGSPEGVVTANQGALYTNDTQELWQKNSGSGNTGWVLMFS